MFQVVTGTNTHFSRIPAGWQAAEQQTCRQDRGRGTQAAQVARTQCNAITANHLACHFVCTHREQYKPPSQAISGVNSAPLPGPFSRNCYDFFFIHLRAGGCCLCNPETPKI